MYVAIINMVGSILLRATIPLLGFEDGQYQRYNTVAYTFVFCFTNMVVVPNSFYNPHKENVGLQTLVQVTGQSVLITIVMQTFLQYLIPSIGFLC